MSLPRPRPNRLRPAALALLGVLCAGGAQAGGREITVSLDRARIEKMPEDAQFLVLGNPIIADVTLLKPKGLMVVTGKGFGVTNLIVLDSAGKQLEEATVRVLSPTGLLTVQRGMERETYACQGRCEPTVSLGDATRYTTDVAGQISARNTLAGPAQGH